MTQVRPLDVLHATSRLGRGGGGVWQFVCDLALAQHALGVRVAVAGLGGNDVADDTAVLREAGVEVHAARQPRSPLPSLGYSPDYARRLAALVPRAGFVHAHGGLRMWTLSAVRRAARRHRRRLVFAPHGGLYPQMLARRRVAKAVLYHAFDRVNLDAVDLLHATCDEELAHCRAYGLRQPAVVIPPGVRPLPPGDATAFLARHPHLAGKRLAGFLGYFDRKKGLPRLVRAWADVRPRDWHLVTAGHDQGGHRGEVEAEIARLKLADDVTLLGPQMHGDKSDFLAALSLFVLPTDWENFGVVLGEALSAGAPVVTTTHTPWAWVADAGVGWHVEPTEVAIAGALRDATSMPVHVLAAKGETGAAEVARRLAWPDAARRLADVFG